MKGVTGITYAILSERLLTVLLCDNLVKCLSLCSNKLFVIITRTGCSSQKVYQNLKGVHFIIAETYHNLREEVNSIMKPCLFLDLLPPKEFLHQTNMWRSFDSFHSALFRYINVFYYQQTECSLKTMYKSQTLELYS